MMRSPIASFGAIALALIAGLASLPVLAAAPKKPAKPVAASAPSTPPASDQIQLETSTITGHRELPRVVYIVPWKSAQAGELPGKPPGSLVDETLAPLDRVEFRREMHYSDLLTAQALTAPAAADQPPFQPNSKSNGE
jgi:hypothetical protein